MTPSSHPPNLSSLLSPHSPPKNFHTPYLSLIPNIMKTILLTFLSLTSAGILSAATLPWNQFRGSTPGSAEEQQIETDALYEVCDKCGLRHQRLIPEEEVLDLLHSIKPDSVISDYYRKFPPLTLEPLIYSGYRPILIPDFTPAPVVFTMDCRL